MGEEKEARRLVRLLLADPLKGKDEWEDGLEGFSEGDGRGLLIRCVVCQLSCDELRAAKNYD